jgi:excisionase family DNA binding protein
MAKRKHTPSDNERLLVRPRRACHLLDCGTTHLYELIDDGELESFLDGRSRKITVESIQRYIAKRLAAADKKNPVPKGSAKNAPIDPLVGREPVRQRTEVLPSPGSRRVRPPTPGTTGSGSVSP